ncbi:MAG TPA: hypothetical protein VG870_11075 [Chitinophagaceae bacterium]|nr:hypothetical protein [Chitinophagaceae bacterium]
MYFQRKDLEGTHYTWDEGKNHLFTGSPSRRTFDRLHGNQVLFLINCFGAQVENFTLEEGKRIETRIQHDLPASAKSELSVFNWVTHTALSASTAS